jgi:hypothetical protein
MRRKSHYEDRILIKITDPDKYLHDRQVTFWAVSDDCADGMLDGALSYSNNVSLRKITSEYMGSVQIEVYDED